MPYVDLFFALRNRPEWLKDCCLVPNDPMVLALEKDQGKKLRRCCSACSIGKHCVKYGKSEEEDIELLVAPGQRGWESRRQGRGEGGKVS